jgi:hypothetical protein
MILIPFPDLQRTPRELKWQLLSNTQGFNGSPEQVSELAGARWAAQFEYNLNLMSRHDARKLKAFLTKLRGRAGRFTLHNMARPEPRGDGRFYAASSNLSLWSEDLSQASWTKTGCTISANAVNAPDGSLTADRLIESIASSNHQVQRSDYSYVSGNQYTFSTYVKPNGRTQVELQINSVPWSGVGGAGANYNLTTLAITGVNARVAATGIIALPDDWFRIWMKTITTTASGATGTIVQMANPGEVYTGDGVSGIYNWGTQLQIGDLTSYVHTTAAITNRLGPYVYGAGQTGNSLVVWGWQESITGILKAGDFFSVNGELKMVTADANTDALGRTTLQFEPPLRSAPPDLAQVTVDQPTGTFMLTEDIVQWSTNGPGLVNIPISCIEAI